MTDEHQTEPVAFLSEMHRLFQFGRLAELVRMVQNAPTPCAMVPEVRLLLARSLADQGRFDQAETAYVELLLLTDVDESLAWEARLWRAFLEISRTGVIAPTLSEGEAALAWVQGDSSRLRIAALARDLTGRALAIATKWYLQPVEAREEAQKLLVIAVQHYRYCEEGDRALAVTLKRGQIMRQRPQAQDTAARALFEEVQAEAEACGNLVRSAEATLRLAESALEAMFEQRRAVGDFSRELAAYQRALDLYQRAGHALGPADVLLSLGQRLVNGGLDGSAPLRQALHVYDEEHNLAGTYEVLSSLSMWYVCQGDLAQAWQCHQQLAALATEMGFLPGQARAAMGIGDYYFRRGAYANALAAYEQARILASVPVTPALIALSLANTYTIMNLPERAESACRKAISIFQSVGAAENLSLAYYILGNVLTKRGNWSGAIAVWYDGLAVDEARQNQLAQAEKLLLIAQATVMQRYRPNGPPIPEAVYDQSIALYDQAITLLRASGEPAAAGVIANAYQLQGQTAQTCARPLDALRYLEQARDAYAALEMEYQVANTNAILGLLCYDLSGRGSIDLYAEAAACYKQALQYFEQADMRDITWKVRYYLALTAFRQGVLALTGDQQRHFWLWASSLLAEASEDIDLIRGQFVELNPTGTQDARLALVADKDHVYTFAVQLHYHYLRDRDGALRWLGRLQGRAFLDALATTPLRTPTLRDSSLLEQEAALLAARARASTQAEAVNLGEQLYALWEIMASDPAASEYLTLRRGSPLDAEQVRALLHQEP